MNARKIALVLLTLVLTAGLAADSFADISSAAVLFLRIAPGSRAAGMGARFPRRRYGGSLRGHR